MHSTIKDLNSGWSLATDTASTCAAADDRCAALLPTRRVCRRQNTSALRVVAARRMVPQELWLMLLGRGVIGRISIELARRRAQKWRSPVCGKFWRQWTVIKSTAEVV